MQPSADLAMGDLVASWFELCHRIGVPLASATEMGEILTSAHSEPQRHYHSLVHVEECLRMMGSAPIEPGDKPVIELALWFHDAVYDPRRNDNEEQSAQLAETWLATHEVATAPRVAALVRMTAGHTVAAGADMATRVVHDIDLSILGASPERYDEYARQIRAEYAHVADAEFRTGRTQVLAAFLALDPLYLVAAYRAALEEPARRNVQRELESLS